jgi:hypothetical protein
MRSKGKLVFLLIVLLFLSFQVVYAWENDMNATVESVVDGDTFWISGKQVRLADIDAPDEGEEGYAEAKLALIKMIDDKKVFLDTDQMTGEDEYGRIIAVAYLKVDKTTYRNVNYNLWKVKKVAVLSDQENNEFDPLTWLPRVGPFENTENINEDSKKYTLKIEINGQGAIDHSTDETTYEEGDSVSIRAEPQVNWRLKEWVLNGEKMGNHDQISFKVSKDTILEVYFEEIPPNSKILFKVTDSENKPIENAVILSLSQPTKQHQINILSDPEGLAQTDSIYHGEYSFDVSKLGYKPVECKIILPSNNELEQLIQLERDKVTLSIQVKSSEGNTVKGAEIVSSIQPIHQANLIGITNTEGIVIFENIEPGTYKFEIGGEYIDPEIFEIETNLPGTTMFKIKQEVQVLSNIQVSVQDDKGNPLSEVDVISTTQPEGQEPINFTINGEYVFENVQPGKYKISFEKDKYQSSSISIYISEFERENRIKPVVLIPMPFNYTPFILVASLVGAIFIGYNYSFNVLENRSKPMSKPTINQVDVNIEEDMLPYYYGSKKGKIIKTICIDNRHKLSDIRKHSGLEEDEFNDVFLDLLNNGDLKSTEKGLYVVRNDIRNQWLKLW